MGMDLDQNNELKKEVTNAEAEEKISEEELNIVSGGASGDFDENGEARKAKDNNCRLVLTGI